MTAEFWAISMTIATGLIGLVLGLRGRRVGVEPRCRRCEYLVTGLPLHRCPECGAVLYWRGAKVRGEKRRLHAVLILGAVLLAIGVGRLIQQGWSHRYGAAVLYKIAPTRLLLSDARGGRTLAIRELDRRLGRGELATRQAEQLVATALEKHRRAKPGDEIGPWLRLLDAHDARGGLSSVQRRRLYEQLTDVSLDARNRVRQGDPIPAGVRCEFHAARTIHRYYARLVRTLRVDGKPVDGMALDWFALLTGEDEAPQQLTALLNSELLAPGMHRVDCTVHERWFYQEPGDPYVDPADFVTTHALTAEVEVLPREASDPLLGVGSDAGIDGLFTASAVRVQNGWALEIELIQHAPAECNVAATLTIVDGDASQEVGSIVVREGEFVATRRFLVPAYFWPSRAKFVMRPCANLVRERADIDAIWGGTIVLKVKSTSDGRTAQNRTAETSAAAVAEADRR